MSVRKRWKAVTAIAVGHVKVTGQPWRIICCVYQTLMSKTFPQESSEAFLNLKSLQFPEQKKLHQLVLPKYFEKRFEEKHGFIWLLKKKLFGTLPPLLNKPMGFITKLLEKQFNYSP